MDCFKLTVIDYLCFQCRFIPYIGLDESISCSPNFQHFCNHLNKLQLQARKLLRRAKRLQYDSRGRVGSVPRYIGTLGRYDIIGYLIYLNTAFRFTYSNGTGRKKLSIEFTWKLWFYLKSNFTLLDFAELLKLSNAPFARSTFLQIWIAEANAERNFFCLNNCSKKNFLPGCQFFA